MHFAQLNFSPNSFVSMHQFSTATKVVGSVQQNNAFIPAASTGTVTQHYQNHSNHANFPSNVQVTSAVMQHQHHYQDTQSKSITSPSGTSRPTTSSGSNTMSAQASWSESVNCNLSGVLKVNLSHFESPIQANVSQAIHRPKTVVTQSVATMTDFDGCDGQEKKARPIQKHSVPSDESNDSSKYSSNENNCFQTSLCPNSCSNIYLKRNASAMAEYLDRAQHIWVPPSIEDFLKKHNIKVNIPNKIVSVNGEAKKDCEEESREGSEVRLSTGLDGSLLYCCSECQMAYPQKELLDRHLAEHRAERKFECNVCGVCLKRKEHLDQHKRGHSEERPFVCEVCCKGFKRNEHLRRHIVIHSGDKNHVCTQCGKAFSRKDHLNKHLQTHINKQGKNELTEATSPLLPVQVPNNLGHPFSSKQILN